jgi:hypothetical protein
MGGAMGREAMACMAAQPTRAVAVSPRAGTSVPRWRFEGTARRSPGGRHIRKVAMSYIPSHAMPHAYVHDEEEEGRGRKAGAKPSNALLIGGAALVGYLLYRALR